MTTNTIDWSKAPEGATEVVQRGRELAWRDKWLNLWCELRSSFCETNYEWKTIATRPTEQQRKSSDEESEWTHTFTGDRCKILSRDSGRCWVKTEFRQYKTVAEASLKPIKPTITKAEIKAVERFAYSLLDKESYDLVEEVHKFTDTYEVTE